MKLSNEEYYEQIANYEEMLQRY